MKQELKNKHILLLKKKQNKEKKKQPKKENVKTGVVITGQKTAKS